ncbi:hypothetical protein [Streptomyces triticiradicis]|uniref:ATP-binding protein n=1 Tax=Streptomyces triticiradicis TaxID=2651189 RepID=A0A7J5DM36_9ACTN|nr:hypothetical protein [Streptomyces triticiradicis]KAB1989788.1 hypothetical protein F8144_05425 [Streptomyces triticiradicis]
MNPPEKRPATPEEGTSAAVLHAVGAVPSLLPLAAESTRFAFSSSLDSDGRAAPRTRVIGRQWLTIGRWAGNIDAAARVADKLVDNAVRHGKPFDDGKIVLRMLALGETEELLIEVDDAYADFPDFDQVSRPNREPCSAPTGLWWLAHYYGTLSWASKQDDTGQVIGKTVQAILPVRWDGDV